MTYEPATYETADSADPVRLQEFLRLRGVLARPTYEWESLARRIRDGGVLSFYTVDQSLTRLGIHPAELPDDVWLKRRAAA